jgi:Fe-S cluster biogenesis protein NfuA/rhodanese-related sulfurtransferase
MSRPDTAGAREKIGPDWTLGQLKQRFPGVELALFAFFGVGSRERSGFAASERLADLLRRHLVFDAEKACARLDALAEEDWRFGVTPSELQQTLEGNDCSVLDARSAEDHALCRIPGSRILSAESVAAARNSRSGTSRVVLVCNDGSQAPAASRHLRGLGLSAFHLLGGLAAWTKDVCESFPLIYPLEEIGGRWHLLADGKTLRYRRSSDRAEQPWRLWNRADLEARPELSDLWAGLPGLELVATTPRSFAARLLAPGDLHHAIEQLRAWTERWPDGGKESEPAQERRELERVLAEEAPKILKSHKGTVEIEGYHDRVLSLRLGGGCAGCASAAVTTQRELAAALYHAVPLLDRIDGAS